MVVATNRQELRAGLCASCSHAQVVTSSHGSVFYLCRLSFTDPRFPRYPPLPVLQCVGYEARMPDPESRVPD
jgi:hypothetical protein